MVRLSGGMKKLIRSYLSDARGMTMTVLKCVNCYLILAFQEEDGKVLKITHKRALLLFDF